MLGELTICGSASAVRVIARLTHVFNGVSTWKTKSASQITEDRRRHLPDGGLPVVDWLDALLAPVVCWANSVYNVMQVWYVLTYSTYPHVRPSSNNSLLRLISQCTEAMSEYVPYCYTMQLFPIISKPKSMCSLYKLSSTVRVSLPRRRVPSSSETTLSRNIQLKPPQLR